MFRARTSLLFFQSRFKQGLKGIALTDILLEGLVEVNFVWLRHALGHKGAAPAIIALEVQLDVPAG